VRSTVGDPPSRPRRRAEGETDDMHSTGNSFPVVGIGAAAGGLEAFRKLLAARPADTGIAFVPIAHLDPTHESMMVDLLRP
jgi:two-component system CheB/CheR fusion protein